MAFENRHYFIESCTFYFLSAQSKSLHQVDIFSQVVLKVFIAEKFLSDGLIDIVLENLDILWRAIGHVLNEFTELLEIKTPDIILVFSHRIKDATYHELFLLIFKILENGQKSWWVHKLRILHYEGWARLHEPVGVEWSLGEVTVAGDLLELLDAIHAEINLRPDCVLVVHLWRSEDLNVFVDKKLHTLSVSLGFLWVEFLIIHYHLDKTRASLVVNFLMRLNDSAPELLIERLVGQDLGVNHLPQKNKGGITLKGSELIHILNLIKNFIWHDTQLHETGNSGCQICL